ncbi:MAG: DUF5684 domain-containing protein [Rikenellaceae bacterium]
MYTLFIIIFTVILVVSYWKIFQKAGFKGWEAIIPIYNVIIFLRIAGKPWWWLLLFCIPVVDIFFMIMAYIEFAKRFGKGTGFAIGLLLLGLIFFPILGFGDAKYTAEK